LIFQSFPATPLSVSVESTESISLKPIIGWSAMSIIRHNKMVLSHLVVLLRNNWAIVCFRQFWKLSSLKELIILLHFYHVMELLSECSTHFVDFSLKRYLKKDFYIKIKKVSCHWRTSSCNEFDSVLTIQKPWKTVSSCSIFLIIHSIEHNHITSTLYRAFLLWAFYWYL